MSASADPVVYVSTYRIRPGKFEDYSRFYAQLVRVVEANEPDVTAFLAFATDDLGEITYIHVYRDGATLDKHMAVLAEQVKLLPGDLTAVMEYLDPVRIQVFGQPGGAAAQMDAALRAAGVPFADKPRYLGGFAH